MKIAILGAGKMGAALARGILKSGLCAPAGIAVADCFSESRDRLAAETGIRAAADNASASAGADATILCVKPQDAAAAAASASLDGRLLISIAAGIPCATLSAAAPGARIVRAMPNTAALVGKSATALAPDKTATAEDLDLAGRIFRSVGVVVITSEARLAAITGLSGSGPAYLYLVVEALIAGAVAEGLPHDIARELAVATLAGAAEMLSVTGEHPATLREMVTSPGGTTIAGLLELERGGVRATFAGAVRAAAARARELSTP